MSGLVAPAPTSLTARTVPLAGPPPDPVALATAADDGFLLQGRRGSVAATGVAAVLRLPAGLRPDTAPAVSRWLAGVPAADPLRRPASGVVAVGALPFAPGEAATLTVPAVTVVAAGDGTAWATVVGPGPLDDDAVARSLAPVLIGPGGAGGRRSTAHPASPPVHVHLWPDGPGFERSVRRALEAIEAGRLTKVVLARQVTAQFAAPVDVAGVLRRLGQQEPACALFACRTGGRAFVGASPELLVRRRGDTVVSYPLAGTAPRRPSVEAAAARLSTAKERAEHRAAAAVVAERLQPWCDTLAVPDHPGLVELSSVVHLGTRLVGRLGTDGRTGRPADALALAAALHPTPAVAGVPTDEALACIRELEPQGRGTYAGPVGWVDARGDGELVVAIRSATVTGTRAVAYAGAGIVAGSDPARELEETTLKLRTALGALGLPVDDDDVDLASARPAG